MMTDYPKLLAEHKESIQKALDYLKYSYKEVQSPSMNLQDAHSWREIRDLRNQATHEYSPKELEPYLKRIKEFIPIILNIEKIT